MVTGYDLEPRPIGRSTQRRVRLLIVVVVVFLPVVLLKPWASPPAVPTEADVASPRPGTDSAFAAIPIRPPAQSPPVWPATWGATPLADATATQAEGALRGLAVHSGAWGVGNAGVGPRMLRDEPWSDWTAAVPESVAHGPLHVATWPGTSLCDGYATIYDNPTLVAVTTPADLVPDWRLAGWWTDGNSVAALAGSVLQVSPAGNRGISYLERTDRAPWPRGRYEFHVIAGLRTVALTVCITRRG